MSVLLSLSSRIKAAPPVPALVAAPVAAPVQVVTVPVVEAPPAPEPVSESVEAVLPSTSEVEEAAVTEAPSEEQCASPPAPASTASSHTESSSE